MTGKALTLFCYFSSHQRRKALKAYWVLALFKKIKIDLTHNLLKNQL